MNDEGPARGATARPRPCASCPYRQSVASGIWHESEYRKLPPYDLPTGQQPVQAFFCHQGDNHVCSGWLGYGDPTELLAVRIGIAEGTLDPSCADYRTAVPLFASGHAAAEHGMRDIEAVAPEALRAMAKIIRTRAAAGDPVTD